MKRVQSLEDEIFALFRKNGPLSVSQVCVELVLSEPGEAIAAIQALAEHGAVRQRPDPGCIASEDELLVVWGLQNRP